ncbi:MAG: hypothetical protein RLZ12_799 [Bacillota bacterium]|jgi:hypothetical protein
MHPSETLTSSQTTAAADEHWSDHPLVPFGNPLLEQLFNGTVLDPLLVHRYDFVQTRPAFSTPEDLVIPVAEDSKPLFSNPLTLNQARQGVVGNCFFLALLNSMLCTDYLFGVKHLLNIMYDDQQGNIYLKVYTPRYPVNKPDLFNKQSFVLQNCLGQDQHYNLYKLPKRRDLRLDNTLAVSPLWFNILQQANILTTPCPLTTGPQGTYVNNPYRCYTCQPASTIWQILPDCDLVLMQFNPLYIMASYLSIIKTDPLLQHMPLEQKIDLSLLQRFNFLKDAFTHNLVRAAILNTTQETMPAALYGLLNMHSYSICGLCNNNEGLLLLNPWGKIDQPMHHLPHQIQATLRQDSLCMPLSDLYPLNATLILALDTSDPLKLQDFYQTHSYAAQTLCQQKIFPAEATSQLAMSTPLP